MVYKTSKWTQFLKDNSKSDKQLDEERNKMYKDFEIMASKLLEDKTKSLPYKTENIKNILNPLEEN